MHFSKIYLQQNFVPDIVADQFGRKVIGVELTLNEGESLEDAKTTAENYIKEYIEKNTVYHSPDFTDRSYKITDNLPPEPAVLPSIQVEDETSLDLMMEEISSCQEIKVLESYKLIAKSNPLFQATYDRRYCEIVRTKGYTKPTTHN